MWWNRLSRLLAPPVFPDEEQTRRAGLLIALIVSTGPTLLLTGLVGVIFIFPVKTIPAICLLIGTLVVLLTWSWARQGRVVAAGLVLLSAHWLVTTLLVFLSDGMRSLNIVFYFSGAVASGLVLGATSTLLYVILTLLTGLIFVGLAQTGFVFPSLFPLPPQTGWLILAMNLTFAITPLHLTLRSLSQALARARRELAERQQAETALQRSESIYRQAIMAAGAVPYYRSQRTNTYTFMGEGIQAMTGYAAAEMTPALFDSLCEESVPRGPLAQLSLAEAERRVEEDDALPWACDYRLRTRSGQTRWVSDTSVKGLNDQGEWEGAIGILQDITQRQQAEARTQALVQGLRAVVEAADELLLAPELDTFYRRAVELGRERLGLERCGLFLIDETQAYLLGTYGTDAHGHTTHEYGARESLTARTALFQNVDRPWIILNQEWAFWDGETRRPAFGHGWVVGTAIRSARGPIGLLYNDAALTGAPVNEALQETVAVYCSILGNILERKQVEGAVRELNTRLEQRAAQLATLNEIGRAVSTQQNLAGVLEMTYQQLSAVLSLDAFYIALYNAATNELSFPFMMESGERWHEPSAPMEGNNLLSKTLQTGQAYLLNRTLEEIQARRATNALGDRSKATASFMVAPLPIGDHAIGVITAHSYTLNAYTHEHVALLTGVGYQVAIAIENARLFEAERRRVALLEVLHDTGLDISAQLNLPRLLQTIVERSVRLLQGTMGELYLTRPDGAGLDLAVNHNLHSDYTVPYLRLGEGVSGLVAESGQPLIVPDYQAWPGRVPRFAAGPYRAMLSTPILWQGQALGVINIVDHSPNRFGPEDVELVRLLAAQAAVAIQTARLFEQTRHRAEEMSLLYAVGVALVSGQDLYHALRALVKELRRLMIVDAFYVVIYDAPTGMLSYPLYLNLDDDLHPPSRSLSENPGLTGEVIATRRTLYLPDIALPAVQQAHKIVVIVDMGVRSYIGIPLLIDDRIIGVLSVQARAANAYTPEQVRLLETLATQVAITVEKSRLLEQVQQELAERKHAEAEVRQLNQELEERVKKRTQELANANQDLESFTYSVSHDLRTPLRGIDGFSRIVLDDYAQALPAEGQRYLQRVRANAQSMSQLIDDLLAFSRLGREPMKKQTVRPHDLARQAMEELTTDRLQRSIDFQLGDLPECQADPALLRQVFINLLSNALKYSRHRALARIEVGWHAEAYYVRDNGTGFDMQFADRLFGVFQRLHRAEEFEGTGVGLAIVKRIIQRHGGRIWAEAAVDRGATFYFTLSEVSEATP